MSSPKFKIGDVVCLNSLAGTPYRFTVNTVGMQPIQSPPDQNGFNGFYDCIWLNEMGELVEKQFREETLTSAEPHNNGV